MTFDKIHAGISFSCVDSCDENTSDTFVRAMSQRDVTEACFLSKWEEGSFRPWRNADECCRLRGVSVSMLIDNVNGAALLERALRIKKAVGEVKPQSKYTHFCKFKLKEAAGKIEETRTKTNPAHHTLYKADDFGLEKLEIIAVESL
jgi:hypothetical protein